MALITALTAAVFSAAPAQATDLPSVSIMDVGAWQSTEAAVTTIWVDGSLDPAPSRGRVLVEVAIPGVTKQISELRPGKGGVFRWNLVLPAEASGTARIRVKVLDAFVGSTPVAFASMTVRMEVQPWVPAHTLTDPGGDTSQYRFIHVDGQGRPAQWDSCRPLIYQVDTSQMPGDYLPYVHEAMGRLQRATGLEFLFGGEANDDLVTRPRDLPDSTILIGWSNPQSTKALEGASLAIADLVPIASSDGRKRIRSGWVILDGTEALNPGFIADKSLGQVLLHELGHVMNLDHVLEPLQLMYPYLGPYSPADYQNGDLAGLAWARSAGCLP